MKIFIEKENKHVELEKSCTGKELLEKLKINPATVLIIKNDEVTLLDDIISDNDEECAKDATNQCPVNAIRIEE